MKLPMREFRRKCYNIIIAELFCIMKQDKFLVSSDKVGMGLKNKKKRIMWVRNRKEKIPKTYKLGPNEIANKKCLEKKAVNEISGHWCLIISFVIFYIMLDYNLPHYLQIFNKNLLYKTIFHLKHFDWNRNGGHIKCWVKKSQKKTIAGREI